MSKTSYQITRFLEQYSFKDEINWKGISSFCKLELNVILEIDPVYSPDGIDFASFSSWFNKGFGSGDIARLGDSLVMLGACNFTTAKVEAVLEGDKILCNRFETSVADLEEPSNEEISKFRRILAKNELQFDEKYQLVIERYIPATNERISFKKDDGTYGIGVVRSVSKEQDSFVLYCYFIYQTGMIGYSMYEDMGSLSEYVFQSMTRSERNRLQNELKKRGKTWNDKLHRVEPVKGKADVGGAYWYINDKLKMVKDIEQGKPTSHFRFIAGNYFLNPEDCLVNLGQINELLRNFLAR